MQIKMSLDGIPSSEDKRRSIINSATGLLVHEIGHVVAAAKQGFPSDLILTPQDTRAHDGVSIIDDKFRNNMEINPSKLKSCLAGGFMAERIIFSEPALHRAMRDIVSMAKIDRRRVADDESIKSYVKEFISSNNKFFDSKDIINIKSIYRKIANFVKSNPRIINGFYIIPMQIWFENIHDKDDIDAAAALSRSNDEEKWYEYVALVENI